MRPLNRWQPIVLPLVRVDLSKLPPLPPLKRKPRRK